MKDNLVKKNILGVGITDASREEILEYILATIEKSDKKVSIVTPNPEILVYSTYHPEFKKILNSANLALNDGVGVSWASKILGKTLKSRVTGVDLVENLCREVSKRGVTVGFLGGRDGVAERAANCLRRRYPNLKVSFVGEEWKFARGPVRSSFAIRRFVPQAKPASAFTLSEAEGVGSPPASVTPRSSNLAILRLRSVQVPQFNNDFSIDILFVAFGFPKQEEWIYNNLPNIPVRVAMGVGGSFDYLSGKVSRAPLFLRNLGLEWLFRLCVQPWRVKRQLALIEFIWLVLKEKLS